MCARLMFNKFVFREYDRIPDLTFILSINAR